MNAISNQQLSKMIKFILYFIKHHNMKTYDRVEEQLHALIYR